MWLHEINQTLESPPKHLSSKVTWRKIWSWWLRGTRSHLYHVGVDVCLYLYLFQVFFFFYYVYFFFFFFSISYSRSLSVCISYDNMSIFFLYFFFLQYPIPGFKCMYFIWLYVYSVFSFKWALKEIENSVNELKSIRYFLSSSSS